ncbi:MAG: hypothetical protein CMP23_14865 [Rickettsiales bacterium]|nr:hypothetical protein [Rickettsiales bacterium]|tara:strand:+ start:762 stop:1349 length:588 start_codon:yes stop_codon:yes gene_type:complete
MSSLFSGADALVFHLSANLLCIALLVKGIYLRYHAAAEFAFAHVMLNLVTFALVWLMHGTTIDIGLGLGLFAIFGILRYRTQALKIIDLTYLFTAIGLAIINGIEHEQISVVEVVLLDLAVLTLPALMEWRSARRQQQTINLVYDRVDLLDPQLEAELMADLEQRLGVRPVRVSLGEIDLLRETAHLTLLVRRGS